MKLAKLKCKESVIIDGVKGKCFEEGKEYLFCIDENMDDIFIVNDMQEVYFIQLSDYFTEEHFDVIHIGYQEEFGLDEVTLSFMKNLYKENSWKSRQERLL